MKTHYFAAQALILLFLGLTSCSSDKTQVSIEPLEKEQASLDVIIGQEDHTYQKVDDTKKLRVGGNVTLNIAPEYVSQITAKTVTTCKANFISEPASKQSHFKGLSVLPVVDILPVEVFTPQQKTNDQIFCDVNIEVLINDKLQGLISLNNVEIADTLEFNNFPLETLFTNPQERYITIQQARQKSIKVPAERVEALTLCRNGRKYTFNQLATISFGEFFDENLFVDSNLIHCRLVFSDIDSGQKWVTTNFHVQQHQPKLTYKIIPYLKSSADIVMRDTRIMDFIIRNNSEADAYFTLSKLKSKIYLAGLYNYNPHSIGTEMSNIASVTADWTIDPNSNIKQPANSNKNVYMLKKGQFLTLTLDVNRNLRCEDHLLNTIPVLCLSVLIGINYGVDNVPSVSTNKFATLAHQSWTESRSPFQIKKGDSIPFKYYLPLSSHPTQCNGKVTKVVSPIRNKKQKYRYCRFY